MAEIDELFDGFDEPRGFETAAPVNPVVIADDSEVQNGEE